MCFSEPDSRLTVLSVKAMLSMLCGGKLVDKLRCKYKLIPLQPTWNRFQISDFTFKIKLPFTERPWL